MSRSSFSFVGQDSDCVVNMASFEKLAAQGLISGAKRLGKFGYNTAVGTTKEDIWSPGGIQTIQTAEQTLEVVSSSTNDTSAGSGARQVLLEGVDGSFNYVTETVTMDGTDVVAVSQKFLRCYTMTVTSRGSYATANAGTITARIASAGATFNEIPVHALFGAAGASYSTHYTVPAGKKALVYYILVNGSSSKTMEIAVHVRTNDGNLTTAPFAGQDVHQFVYSDIPNFIELDLGQNPFFLPPKADVWFEGVVAAGGSGTAFVSLNYGMIEFDA